MALYVTRPPNPVRGTDWKAAVPGEYLYNVTGITATLSTANGAGPAMLDSSGFANDGTYLDPSRALYGQPGLVAGDEAVTALDNTILAQMPMTGGLIGADYTIGGWLNPPSTADCAYLILEGFSVTPALAVSFFYQIFNGAASLGMQRRVFPGPTGLATYSAPTPALAPGAHFVAVGYDPASGTARFYVDGLPVGDSHNTNSPSSEDPILGELGDMRTQFPVTLDEVFFCPQQLADADIAALYAAASVDFLTWTAAVLAFSPFGFYHLDEFVPGTGRQVALEVTDGSSVVEMIPTGFPRAPGPGPYSYSWVPRLNASTQTPSQLVTTVAVPALVLPPGYTVGSNTPDLVLGDLWSDIAIWWDSNIMDAQAGQSAYLFPPPVHLVYHQEPH